MADFRSVQTRIWREDEWFIELVTDARLFWIYLFTNPSASPAGIYRLPTRTMAYETGIPEERVAALLAEFENREKAYYRDGVVWVVKMRDLQFPDIEGSGAWQTGTRMQRDVDAIPDRNPLKAAYIARLGYPVIIETQKGQKTIKTVGFDRRHALGQTIRPQVAEQPASAPAEQPATEQEVKEFINQYELLLGVVPTAEYPEICQYIQRLHREDHQDWWLMALRITTQQADRPMWAYVRGVLNKWLAKGSPQAVTQGDFTDEKSRSGSRQNVGGVEEDSDESSAIRAAIASVNASSR